MHSIPSIDYKPQLLLYCAQVLLAAIKSPPLVVWITVRSLNIYLYTYIQMVC